jgi:hypothetical protein
MVIRELRVIDVALIAAASACIYGEEMLVVVNGSGPLHSPYFQQGIPGSSTQAHSIVADTQTAHTVIMSD